MKNITKLIAVMLLVGIMGTGAKAGSRNADEKTGRTCVSQSETKETDTTWGILLSDLVKFITGKTDTTQVDCGILLSD